MKNTILTDDLSEMLRPRGRKVAFGWLQLDLTHSVEDQLGMANMYNRILRRGHL